MIKILFYTLSLITLFSCRNKQEEKADLNLQNIELANQKQDIKKIDLEKVDYKSYCGKTLGELLENEILKNYESHYFTDEPPLKLSSIVFTYPNSNKSLSVYFGDLVYQEKMSSDMSRRWSFDLLKKEKFEFITIVENAVFDRPIFSCDCEE